MKCLSIGIYISIIEEASPIWHFSLLKVSYQLYNSSDWNTFFTCYQYGWILFGSDPHSDLDSTLTKDTVDFMAYPK